MNSMILQELRLIEVVLLFAKERVGHLRDPPLEFDEALRLIRREIKLKTIDPRKKDEE